MLELNLKLYLKEDKMNNYCPKCGMTPHIRYMFPNGIINVCSECNFEYIIIEETSILKIQEFTIKMRKTLNELHDSTVESRREKMDGDTLHSQS